MSFYNVRWVARQAKRTEASTSRPHKDILLYAIPKKEVIMAYPALFSIPSIWIRFWVDLLIHELSHWATEKREDHKDLVGQGWCEFLAERELCWPGDF